MHKKFAKAAVAGVMAASMLASTAALFAPMSANAGLMVGQVDFDEGIGLPWHTCETNPAKQKFNISNGTYNVTIINKGGSEAGGESRWDLQLRHRKLKIKAGETYKVSFDVNASNEGRLYTKIGDLGGSKEIWHNCMGMSAGPSGEHNKSGADFNMSWDPLDIQKGDNHFECEFKADEDMAVAEWAFHYGGRGQHQTDFDCFPEGTELKFDNLKLECTTSSECDWDTTDEMGFVTPRSDVRLNQVGYFTNLKKVASYATDEKIDPVKFVIKDASGKEVYSGTGKQYDGEDGGKDYGSGEYIQFLDFTDFNETGTYTIEVDDTSNVQENRYTKEKYNMYISHDFEIVDPKEKNVYDGILKNALNYYYQNRSGVAIEEQYITSKAPEATGDDYKTGGNLAHQAGHESDIAYIQDKWIPAYKPDGSDVQKSNGTIEGRGGWYDAGDHGKYVVNGGISVWTLQNMYELSKYSKTDSKWADGQTMAIPQKYELSGNDSASFDGTGSPDILDEARVELAWMFKMIRDDGMVYHKLHDHKWTGLATEPWNYEEDHTDADGNKVKGWGTIRIVKPVSTAATLNVAAAAAQAARLWKGIDDDFAAECLANAEKTYKAAKANPDVFAPLDQAIGGGAYGDNYVDDDFYWAACELYATTGDKSYYDDLMKYNNTASNETALNLTTTLSGGENSGSFTSFNWGCTGGLGTLSLWLNKSQLSDTDAKTVEASIVKAADTYVAREDAEGMGIPYTYTEFEDPINVGPGIKIKGYEWGSNSFVVNNAIVMAYAYKIKGDNKYISGVGTALDYIFGRNGQGISYVTGTGDYYTKNPHHRYWSYELDHNFPMAPQGVMSGGPGSGLQDPYVGGLGYERGKVAPQKCYVDSIEAWSVNEVTINWNAPFAWAISFLEDEIVDAPAPDEDPKDPDQPTLLGDANVDDKVTISDAVAILQSLANSNKYGLKEEGRNRGDCVDRGDGITGQDAAGIQLVDAGVIKQADFPIKADQLS